jgi:hypothetical protein
VTLRVIVVSTGGRTSCKVNGFKRSWSTAYTNGLRCPAPWIQQLVCMTCRDANYPALGKGPYAANALKKPQPVVDGLPRLRWDMKTSCAMQS